MSATAPQYTPWSVEICARYMGRRRLPRFQIRFKIDIVPVTWWNEWVDPTVMWDFFNAPVDGPAWVMGRFMWLCSITHNPIDHDTLAQLQAAVNAELIKLIDARQS